MADTKAQTATAVTLAVCSRAHHVAALPAMEQHHALAVNACRPTILRPTMSAKIAIQRFPGHNSHALIITRYWAPVPHAITEILPPASQPATFAAETTVKTATQPAAGKARVLIIARSAVTVSAAITAPLQQENQPDTYRQLIFAKTVMAPVAGRR